MKVDKANTSHFVLPTSDLSKKVLIFSAPSGSGKTTIVKHLLSVDKRLEFSVSACTRPKRENEVNGRDYFFLSMDEFRRKIESGDFIEYEEVYQGNLYGTLKSETEKIWNANKVVVFDVDVKGGMKLKSFFGGNALSVFVKPPGIAELKTRLMERSTETEEVILERLEKARVEFSFENKFDCILLNDDLKSALRNAEKLVNDFLSK
ncbi:MAG: guanylate kinase [Bacteroidia bacterium]